MLPVDITLLVLKYLIPLYKLPDWVDPSIHKYILSSRYITSNPRAVLFIKKNLIDNYWGSEFAKNPSPIIMRHVQNLPEEYFDDLCQIYNLMENPSDDPEFREWAKTKICKYIDKVETFAGMHKIDTICEALRKNRSKEVFDKYLANSGFWPCFMYGDHYPYFTNETDEVNMRYFIIMLNQMKKYNGVTEQASMQAMPVPLIIKKLSIMAKLSDPEPYPEQYPDQIYEKVDILLGKHIIPKYISYNPGAIHILKARPDLIDPKTIYSNSKVGDLIECELVKPDLKTLLTLTHSDPKIVDAIKKLIKEPCKKFSDIEDGIIHNHYIFEASGDLRLIRRVMAYLFY